MADKGGCAADVVLALEGGLTDKGGCTTFVATGIILGTSSVLLSDSGLSLTFFLSSEEALKPNPATLEGPLSLVLPKLNLPKVLVPPKLLTLPKLAEELQGSTFLSSLSLSEDSLTADIEPNPTPSPCVNEPKPEAFVSVLLLNPSNIGFEEEKEDLLLDTLDEVESGIFVDDDVPKLALSPKLGCALPKPPKGIDDDEDVDTLEAEAPNAEKPPPIKPVVIPSNTLSSYFFSNFRMSSISLPLYFPTIFGNSSTFSGLCFA